MPPEPLGYLGVRFSPDGNYLYFVRGEMGQALHYLYRAPVLGGTPQKLVTDVDSNISFSPDGRSLAYVVQNNPELGKFRLVIYSVETGEGKTLVLGNLTELINDPAWSPDGKTIVCVRMQPSKDAISGLVGVNASTGKQSVFFESKWGFLNRPVWLPDGRGLIALSTDKETNYSRARIVEISYPDGKEKAVTHDINDYADLSVAGDGHTLATVLQQSHFDLFTTAASSLGGGQADQLTSGVPVGDFSWTPDGQLIISQDLTMSLFNPQTRSKTPLTSLEQDGFSFQPSSCANGRYIVFVLAGHGGAKAQNIWRMDAGGGNLKEITDGKSDLVPRCTPDGRWVYYIDQADNAKLFKISMDGGKPEQVTGFPAFNYALSPDGKLAAAHTFVAPGSPKEVLAIVPLDSPQNVKTAELQRLAQGRVRFLPDGKALVYVFRDKDADNLWMQPLDGSPGKQLTNFKSERILDFHWSFDGSKVGLVRGHTDSDVVLLRESQQ
jgi:eukaryotic-like serine/threonine-protein kinase